VAGELRGQEIPWPETAGSLGLKQGCVYRVLMVRAEPWPPRGVLPVHFVVLDDDDEPTWFPAAMFSLVSARIPPNWTLDLGEWGELELGPASWRDKFWGRFHGDDGDAWTEAHRIYREELRVMESDEVLPRQSP
jgi:hypothetical protein